MKRLFFIFILVLALMSSAVFAQDSLSFDKDIGILTIQNKYGHKITTDIKDGSMTFYVSYPDAKGDLWTPVAAFIVGRLQGKIGAGDGEILSDIANNHDEFICRSSYIIGEFPIPHLLPDPQSIRERYDLKVECKDKAIVFKVYNSHFDYPMTTENYKTYDFRGVWKLFSDWRVLLEYREHYFTTYVRLLSEYIAEYDEIAQESLNE